MRYCKQCKLNKELSKFIKVKSNKDGLSLYCNQCLYLKNKKTQDEYAKKHKEEKKQKGKIYRDKLGFKILKGKRLKTMYNISMEEYERKYINQNGLCDICGKSILLNSQNTCLDHNHNTNQIRSLLCRWCNTGIGFFNEDIETFLKAINYIKKYDK